MQNTVFIERGKRAKAAAQAGSIADRLANGEALVLFAEGTTGSGHRILPFKSALFGAVDGALARSGLGSIDIQPVAISYLRLHGLPLGRYHQARAAWPGDLALAPHLKSVLADAACDVRVSFSEPIRVRANGNRKDIAERVRARVRQEFAAAMRMRFPAGPPDHCVSGQLE
jgi:1-acyl-sn-glycerol-3-phosphate acyltransferase